VQGDDREVAMIHLECHVCGVTATCVVTSAVATAWDDHMSAHVDPEAFSQWTWMVTPLPFGS